MPKRLTFLVIACLTAGMVYSFGCGGGGGGDQPPPPPQTIDKVVWAQEVPIDFELAVPVPAAEGEEQKTGKAAASALTDEEKKQSKMMAFFAANPDGSGLARLTPKGMSAVQVGDGLSPNGDFWFFTKAGLFVTNVSDPRPRMLLSAQELATKFSDGNEPGLYWSEALINAINAHTVTPYGIRIYFVPAGDGSQYIALISLPMSYIKASSGGEDASKAYLLLRYDSSNDGFEYILPYLTTTDGKVTTVGEGGDKTTFELLEPGVGKPGFGNVSNVISFNKETNKLLYSLKAAKLSDAANARTFIAEYDPITKKHTIFELPSSFDNTKQITLLPSLYNAGDCALYEDDIEIPFEQKDCKVNFTSELENDVRKKVANCMQTALAGKKLAIKCAPRRDITDIVSSKDKLPGFLSMTPAGEPKTITEIETGVVKQVDYVNTSTDITCTTENDPEKYCQPSNIFMYVSQPPPAGAKKSKIKIYQHHWNGLADSPYVFFLGYLKDGNNIRSGWNLLNLSTGEIRLVDKDDVSTAIGDSSAFKTAEGILLVYLKNSNEGFAALYAFDPAWGAPLALTKYAPNNYGGYGSGITIVKFADMVDGKMNIVDGISYDRKLAFLQMRDDIGRRNTFKLDLTKVFPQKVAEGETPPAAQEGEETSENEDMKKEATPLGENWVLAHPAVENKVVDITLQARIGDELVWLSNQDGFDRAFWNGPEDIALKRFSSQDVDSNEQITAVAQKLGTFAMPSGAPAFDISTDIGADLACGKDNPKATYCADARQMCVNKVCVDMYSCSASAPKGVCYKTDEGCQNGVCVAIGPAQCVPACQPGQTCVNGVCVAQAAGCTPLCGPGLICVNGQCIPTGCVPNCTGKICGDDGCQGQCGACAATQTCEQGQCVEKEPACTASKDCDKFKKCEGGSCVTAGSQECQVADQCGQPPADFGCVNNVCYSKAKNVVLKTTFGKKMSESVDCPTKIAYDQCKTCRYSFSTSWQFNSDKDETFNLQFFKGGELLSTEKEITCQNLSCTAPAYTFNVTFYTTTVKPHDWVKPSYKVKVWPKGADTLSVIKSNTFLDNEVNKCVQ